MEKETEKEEKMEKSLQVGRQRMRIVVYRWPERKIREESRREEKGKKRRDGR